MKTKRLDFNYRSLAPTKYIELIGSIPDKQTYNASSGEYAPDYTLEGSHLVLQPHVSVNADTGVLGGEVTSQLTNIKWTEQTTTTTTVINSANTDYAITLGGAENGRITMKRNVPAGSSLTLIFEADFLDYRKNEVHHITESYRVSCQNEAVMPTLQLDRGASNLWNPFRDTQQMEFNASLRIGTEEVPVTQRTFRWEKKRADGTWSAIGADETDDFGWSVSNNGATYRQNLNYIGEKQDMRVRVAYGSVTLNAVNEAMTRYFTMVRRLPDYDFDYINVPDNIEPETKFVYPAPLVQDREGVVQHPEEHLNISWYTGEGLVVGNPAMTLEATGPNPAIATEKINLHGMVLGIDVQDRGNYKKVVADGKLVVVNVGGTNYAVVAL